MKRILGFILGAIFVLNQPLKPTPANTNAREIKKPQYQVGVASWYGPRFHGRKAANGRRFNRYGLTCAHKTLPLGSRVKVEVLGQNGEPVDGASLELPVTDRGPYIEGRILDLSEGAANWLGVKRQGLATVRITKIG